MAAGEPDQPLRLMIVDDHAFVREALAFALVGHRRFELIASCATGVCAIAEASEALPDVAVVDFAVGDMSGPDIIAAMRAVSPGTRFVLLTGAALNEAEREALARCAEVFLRKEGGFEALLAGIAEAAAAKPHRPGRTHSDDREGLLAAASLTERERAIVRDLAAGDGVNDIAERLAISPATVRKHRENSMMKLNVNSTAALVRVALQLGWV